MSIQKLPVKSLRAPAGLAVRNGIKETMPRYRSVFMQDRDRVLYSAPFRILAGKTQVYVSGIDENMRTRLTHTLEVAQIAKTIATFLKLDVDLAEAIALGHDIGHTPYGHAGERELHRLLNPSARHVLTGSPFCTDREMEFIAKYREELGFKHNLRGVEVAIHEAEITEGRSLLLTNFTLYGICRHSAMFYMRENNAEERVGYYNRFLTQCLLENRNPAWSFEAFVVEQADEIAQRHHDLEDAVRGQLLSYEYVYEQILECFEPFFTKEHQGMLKILKKAKDEKDGTVFYAELSQLIVNLLVTRLIVCTIHNFNSFIRKQGITQASFPAYVAGHDGTEEKKLVGYEEIGKDTGFLAALDQFKKNISDNVLYAYEIQCSDTKAGYIIRKTAQALYENPQQLPDENLVAFGVSAGLFDYQTAKEKMRREGKGIVRNDVLSVILKNREDSISTGETDLTGETPMDRPLMEMKLLRCVCNYIADQTDRELHTIYQNLYE